MIFNVANQTSLFVYRCNGETDNIFLKNFITSLQDKGFDKFTVEIEGKFGVSTGGFTVGSSSLGRVTLDFSKCDVITINQSFLNVTNCFVKGLHLNLTGGSSAIAINGVDSIFEDCSVVGTFTGGTCWVFNLTNSKMFNCQCDVSNSNKIVGINGSGNIIQGCEISVKSTTESAYGIEVTDSIVSDSRFRGETDSALTTTSGNGGIGGGYFVNCRFLGFGALKGQGFYIRSAQWATMLNCVFRGYTKDTANGWGCGLMGQADDATTVSLLGVNCNQVSVEGFSQSKSFELLSGYGVYSGTFFTAVNVGENLTSLGAYNRNRT